MGSDGRAVLMAVVLASAPAVARAADPHVPPPVPEARPEAVTRFVVDPVSDGAVLSAGLGVAALSEVILGTGEIVPQQPQSTSRLLAIDRGVLDYTRDDTWALISNLGMGGALAFAVVDPFLTAYRSGGEAAIVDFFLYAESITTTWAATNLTKLAVRRPRPEAYEEAERLRARYPDEPERWQLSETSTALSFFSVHSSLTASVSATATYLAFARDPRGVRPWLTLTAGTVVTGLTAYGRVRAKRHFPTDVMAGVMVGAGIGVLVPHLHRVARPEERPVWIGMQPLEGGGLLTLNGPAL